METKCPGQNLKPGSACQSHCPLLLLVVKWRVWGAWVTGEGVRAGAQEHSQYHMLLNHLWQFLFGEAEHEKEKKDQPGCPEEGWRVARSKTYLKI